MDSTFFNLTFPQMLADIWFPTDGSAKNYVDDPAIFILWVCGIFLVFNAGLMVFFAFRFRQKKKQGASTGTTHNTALEVTWSIIPAFLLAVMFIWGFRNYLAMSNPPDGAYDIEVTGRSWNWSFSYPDGGSSKAEEGDQFPALHAPAGRPVRLTLMSEDVIHSVFIPQLRIKKDVVPGRYNQMWFEAEFNEKTAETVDLPTEDGGTVTVKRNVYNLFCTEYCGQDHSKMITKVYIYPPEDFEYWYVSKSLYDPKTPLKQIGETLYQQCKSCHNTNGQPGGTGPTWQNLFGRQAHKTSAGPVDVDKAYIYESIRNPSAKIVDGYKNQMPAFSSFTDREIRGIIEFMKSISENAKPDYNPDLQYGDLKTDGTLKGAGSEEGAGEGEGATPPEGEGDKAGGQAAQADPAASN